MTVLLHFLFQNDQNEYSKGMYHTKVSSCEKEKKSALKLT